MKNSQNKSIEYFSTLNYSLANEDTQIEYQFLPENLKRVFSIAGSGARCLPLLAKNPKFLDIVDSSKEQLYLAELRYKAAQQLSYEEFLFFLGYRGAIQNLDKKESQRSQLFQRLPLSSDCHKYWLQGEKLWAPEGFLRLGQWEKHFQKLGTIFRDILRCDFAPIFEAQSLESQIHIYEKHWPRHRWNTFLQLVASEWVFNRFLYKGHFSGQTGQRTDKRSPSQMIAQEFDRIFKTQLVRKNYFFQILFLGRIQYEEGLPLEAHRGIFELIKKSGTQVRFICGDLTEKLKQESYDFISLSDTISYLPEAFATTLLQQISPHTGESARIVIRSFLRRPPQFDSSGWNSLLSVAQGAREEDGTGVYEFDCFEKSGGPQ